MILKSRGLVLLVLGLLLVVTFLLIIPIGTAPNIVGPNYKNVTIRTQVNVTNSRPEVISIRVADVDNISLGNITVNAGSFKGVSCNATIRDWNGFADVYYVNATLWHMATSSYEAANNNNSHYTNASCTNNGDGSGFTVSYLCNFNVVYYANNGTWMCNITALDLANASGASGNTTVFLPVYALNVTDGVDFGNLAVDNISTNASANITNLGNMAINVTVEGYGLTRGDGLAVICSLGGNITAPNERFHYLENGWENKIPLNASGPTTIPNLTMIKQNDSNMIRNSTFWQLYVNSTNAPGGNCSGYVIFTAIAPI